MKRLFFLLFDTGIAERYPGFPDEFSFAEIPVLGTHIGLEIILSNLKTMPSAADHSGKAWIITSPKKAKWYEEKVNDWNVDVEVVPFNDNAENFISTLEKLKNERFIVQNMASIVSFYGPHLTSLYSKTKKDQIIKCSIHATPVDCFICGKDALRKTLLSIGNVNEVMDFHSLFKQLLLDFNELIDIPGIVFFHNTLYGFFQTHLD